MASWDRTHAPVWHQRTRIAVELAEVNRDARVHQASTVNWNCWWHKRVRTHQRRILNMPSPQDILGWIQLCPTVSIKYVLLLREDFLVASKVSFGTHLLASKKAKGFRVCRTQFAVAERQADKTFKRQEGDLSLGILGKELANGFNQRGEIQSQGGMWQKWMRPCVG